MRVAIMADDGTIYAEHQIDQAEALATGAELYGRNQFLLKDPQVWNERASWENLDLEAHGADAASGLIVDLYNALSETGAGRELGEVR